jgi:hypothetical protein
MDALVVDIDAINLATGKIPPPHAERGPACERVIMAADANF